ncbi:MAG: glycosyltransferase [Candidatus Helarchaeota archaeon]
MKIGLFSDVTVFNPPFPSGVSRFFRDISTQLTRRGHKVIIFEPAVYLGQAKTEFIKKNILVYRLFSVRWTLYSNYPIGVPLKELFFEVPYDLDIIHANHAGMGIYAAVTSWKKRIPRVISYHTPVIHYLNYIPSLLFFLKSQRLVNYLIRKIYEQFFLTIVPTQGVKNMLIRRGFKGPFDFFPTCLDLKSLPTPSHKTLTAFKENYSLDGKKIILFVGRMSPEKGVNQILQIIPSVIKKIPTAHFLMVGTGPFLEIYKSLARKSKITDHVTFTGYLSDFDLFSAINVSDVGLIFVNNAQIFDMTILEYWNYGLPLVIMNAIGIDEIVHDGDTGLLFSTLNEAKNAILTILSNETLAQRIRANCKRTVQEKYDIRKCICQLEALYRKGAQEYYHSFKTQKFHFLRRTYK